MKKFIVLIAVFSLLFVAPTAEAFLGFGDIVFDPSVFMETLLGYVKQVEDYSNQAAQLSNQIQSLANEAQNLMSMDQTIAGRVISNISSSLSKLSELRNSIRGITMDYQKLENAWESVYAKDFKSFSGKSIKDYILAADRALNQTNNATYDAMKAQGLIAHIGDDQRNLESLLRASQSAGGALSAAQVGNQIAGVTAQQLMRLQHIMAASYRAQASFFAEQKQKEAMSQADSERFFQRTIPKPGDGKGQGFKKF